MSAKALRIVAMPVAIATVLFGFGYWICWWDYYQVQYKASQVPEIEAVEIDGFFDTGVFEIHTLRVSVKDKEWIEFSPAGRGLFDDRSNIYLSQIGPYRFRTGRGEHMNIGQRGEFVHLFPFTINNVQDVIKYYDDILEAIEQWHIQGNVPHLVITQESHPPNGRKDW